MTVFWQCTDESLFLLVLIEQVDHGGNTGPGQRSALTHQRLVLVAQSPGPSQFRGASAARNDLRDHASSTGQTTETTSSRSIVITRRRFLRMVH